MCAVTQVLFHASKQHQEDSLLDVLMSVDRRSQGVGKNVKGLLLLRNFLDVVDIVVSDGGLSDPISCLACKSGDVVGENDRPRKKCES